MQYDEDFIREKLDKLRLERNVSERKMSIDLGHSASYMNNISTGYSFSSLIEFLYTCEYLEIEPKLFFELTKELTLDQRRLTAQIEELSPENVSLILQVIERLKK